jgi:hypothetical protein
MAVNRYPLLNMAAACYAALQQRENCLDCGGRGNFLADNGDGEADWEPCFCSNDAAQVLATFGELYKDVADEWAWNEGCRPESADELANTIIRTVTGPLH